MIHGMGKKKAESAKPGKWGALLARAVASLDEQGEEAFDKKRANAEWRRKRNESMGLRVKIDFDGVKRALTEYYEGCVGLAPFRGCKQTFSDCGVLLADFFDGENLEPELGLVFRYIQRQRDRTTKGAAMDLGREAQEAQRRLVTEEGCRLNQRAVEVSLRATMKDIYGEDGEGSGSGGSGRPQVVYNLPNLTLNMITAPAGLLGAAKPQAAAIDVSAAGEESDGS